MKKEYIRPAATVYLMEAGALLAGTATEIDPEKGDQLTRPNTGGNFSWDDEEEAVQQVTE